MIASKAWADVRDDIRYRLDTLADEQKIYLAKLDREQADWKKKKSSGDKAAEKKFIEVSENIKNQKKYYEIFKKIERPNAAMEVATTLRDGIMKDFVKLVKDQKVDRKRVDEIIKQINGNYEIMGKGLFDVDKTFKEMMNKRPKDLDAKVAHAYGQVLACRYDITDFMKSIESETKKAMDLVKQILSAKVA